MFLRNTPSAGALQSAHQHNVRVGYDRLLDKFDIYPTQFCGGFLLLDYFC